MADQPVWLITGCSSGFGLEIARTVLSHGHHLIATSRSPSRTPHLVEEITAQGGHWLELDIASSQEKIDNAIRDAHGIYGRVDFLVNNAGFGPVGGFEDLDEAGIRSVFETNVFGTFNVTRSLLPYMRARRSGTVINVSSRSGFEGLPCFGIYAASKFALEGWSESLAAEYAGFGIRVLLVEPGLFRTGFSSSSSVASSSSFGGREGMGPFYEGTVVEEILERLEKIRGEEPGDPQKAAERIWEVAVGEGMGMELRGNLRVVLGASAQRAAVEKAERMRVEFEGCEGIARSADF